MENFPVKTEVWTPDGESCERSYDRPLIDNAAQHARRDHARDSHHLWRADEPATLVLVQALDDGDPRKTVPKRDRVSLLKAPFTRRAAAVRRDGDSLRRHPVAEPEGRDPQRLQLAENPRAHRG